jgi:hypothetical protein
MVAPVVVLQKRVRDKVVRDQAAFDRLSQ